MPTQRNRRRRTQRSPECRRNQGSFPAAFISVSAHKEKRALKLIEDVGAEVWFLPPCSPDLNSIEKMWSKVKQLLRGEKTRSQESLLDAIGVDLGSVCEADALGWFTSGGYSLV